MSNAKSEKSDNGEIVHPDLKGIDFNGPMFMNKDEEVIVEKVVKDNKENSGSPNASKDSQVLIASYDAQLINFKDESLKTKESSFQEFSGHQNKFLEDKEDTVLTQFGSEEKHDNECIEQLVDLNFDDEDKFCPFSNDIDENTIFIRSDLEDIDFSVQPTLQSDNDSDKDSVCVGVIIHDDIVIHMRAQYAMPSFSPINPTSCDDCTACYDATKIAMMIFIMVSLYLSTLKLLHHHVLVYTESCLFDFDDYFRTKNPTDLSNTDLNFIKWMQYDFHAWPAVHRMKSFLNRQIFLSRTSLLVKIIVSHAHCGAFLFY